MNQRRAGNASHFLRDLKFDTALDLTFARQAVDEPRLSFDLTRQLQALTADGVHLSPRSIRAGIEILPKMIAGVLLDAGDLVNTDLSSLIRHASSHTRIAEWCYISSTSKSTLASIDAMLEETSMQRRHLRKQTSAFYMVGLSWLDSMKSLDVLYQAQAGDKDALAASPSYSCVDGRKQTFFRILLGKMTSLLWFDGEWWCITTDQWRMIGNKMCEIALALHIAELHANTLFTPELYTALIALLKWGSNQLIKYGNRWYTCLKSLEGYVQGLILIREEQWDNSDFLKTIHEALIKDKLIPDCDYTESPIYLMCSQLTTPELVEFGWCGKLLGHPDIIIAEGLAKLYQRTHKEITIEQDAIDEMVCLMKMDFCKSYFKKYRSWPLVELSPDVNPSLARCILKNVWIKHAASSHTGAVDLHDFEHVTLSRVEKFDYVDDLLPVLKDRSIAPTVSMLKKYVQGARIPISEQKVLLKFLVTTNISDDVRQYLTDFKNDPELCFDYLVIKLTQKERELKVEGRFFGASGFVERTRRVLLEHNTANLMSKYDEYQTMTISELDRLSRLVRFRLTRLKSRTHRPVYFAIDAEAWNNYFRSTLVKPCLVATFDKIFGDTHYSQMMEIYERAWVYHIDKSKQMRGWSGQLGGIEGLSQKAWTWVYARVTAKVLDNMGYMGQIIVNGDDLRLVVMFPTEDFLGREEKVVILDFAENLAHEYERYGFIIKVNESCASETLLTYGKVMQINESFMTSCLKKGIKLHGMSDPLIPTTDKVVGGIWSAAYATCAVTMTHHQWYFLACVWSVVMLSHWAPELHYASLAERQLLAFWSVPSAYGGFPTLSYAHFFVRGESDLLAHAVTFALWTLFCQLRDYSGTWHMCLTPEMTRGQIVQLCTDPYSLPIRKPSGGAAILLKYMRHQLIRIVRNKEIKHLLNWASPAREKEFLRYLGSFDPLCAKVMSVIWECSPFNLHSEIIKKYETSQSVFQFLSFKSRRSNVYRLLRDVVNKDIEYRTWFFQIANKNIDLGPFASVDTYKTWVKQTYVNSTRMKDLVTPVVLAPNIHPVDYHQDMPCPTKLVMRQRREGWGKYVTGVTYPSPMSQIHFYTPIETMYTWLHEIHVKWAKEGRSVQADFNQPSLLFNTGGRRPILGKRTKEKIGHVTLDLEVGTTAGRKVKKLLKARAMTVQLGNGVKRAIAWALECLQKKTIDELAVLAPQTQSGTTSHRMQAKTFQSTVSPNELPNKSQLVSIDPDYHTVLQEGVGDFSINYIALFCHLVTMGLYPLEHVRTYCSPFQDLYHVDINLCRYCYYDVKDTVVITDELNLDPLMPDDLPNLLHLNDDEIAEFDKSLQAAQHVSDIAVDAAYAALEHDDIDDIAHHVVAYHLVRLANRQDKRFIYTHGIQSDVRAHIMELEVPAYEEASMSRKDWKSVDIYMLVDQARMTYIKWVRYDLLPSLKRSELEVAITTLEPQLLPFEGMCEWLIKSARVPQFVLALAGDHVQLPAGATSTVNTLQRVIVNHLLKLIPIGGFENEPDPVLIWDRSLPEDDFLQQAHASLYYFIRSQIYRLFQLAGIDRQNLIIERDDNVWWRIYSFYIELSAGWEISPEVIHEHMLNPTQWLHLFHAKDEEELWAIPECENADEIPEINSWLFEIIAEVIYRTARFAGHYDEQWIETLSGIFLEMSHDRTHADLDVGALAHPELMHETFRAKVFRMDRAQATDWVRRNARDLALPDRNHRYAGRLERRVATACAAHQIIRVHIHDFPLALTQMYMAENIQTAHQYVTHAIPGYDEVLHHRPDPSWFGRILGNMTTTISKLREIQAYIRALHVLDEPGCALMLAEGEGGSALQFMQINPQLTVVFNSLYESSTGATHTQMRPQAFAMQGHALMQRLDAQANYSSFNDLSHPEIAWFLQGRIQSFTARRFVDFITYDREAMDIEYSLVDEACLLTLLRCIVLTLRIGGCAVIKHFITSALHMCKFMCALSYLFNEVHVIKPSSSHFHSGEYYIVGTNLRISDHIRELWEARGIDLPASFANPQRVLGPWTDFMVELSHRRQIWSMGRMVYNVGMVRDMVIRISKYLNADTCVPWARIERFTSDVTTHILNFDIYQILHRSDPIFIRNSFGDMFLAREQAQYQNLRRICERREVTGAHLRHAVVAYIRTRTLSELAPEFDFRYPLQEMTRLYPIVHEAVRVSLEQYDPIMRRILFAPHTAHIDEAIDMTHEVCQAFEQYMAIMGVAFAIWATEIDEYGQPMNDIDIL